MADIYCDICKHSFEAKQPKVGDNVICPNCCAEGFATYGGGDLYTIEWYEKESKQINVQDCQLEKPPNIVYVPVPCSSPEQFEHRAGILKRYGKKLLDEAGQHYDNKNFPIIIDSVAKMYEHFGKPESTNELYKSVEAALKTQMIIVADPLRFLPDQLINENGGGFGFVCIWRQGVSDAEESSGRYGITVGEWLSKPENQSGTWLIDGGWGGPPGPIHVRWNQDLLAWENGGYCGVWFRPKEELK